MKRVDLLQVFYFGGGGTPSLPTGPTKTIKVQKWRRLVAGTGGDNTGFPERYESTEVKPKDTTGWEEYIEEQVVPIDANEDSRKAEAEAAALKEAEILKKRKGQAATILTGGQGVTDKAQVKKPTLLGGNRATLS